MTSVKEKTKEDNLIKKLEKISVNLGIGKLATESSFNDKALEGIKKDFALITGQKPSTRPARKSIAGFKLREGTVVGLKATLRGKRMIDFLNRLIKVVLPRIRDFKGVDIKSVDHSGNLSIGIKENVVFPEINLEVSKITFGLEITIVPKISKKRGEMIDIYKELGIPFKKNK